MLINIRRSLGNYLEGHPTLKRIVALCQKRRVAFVIGNVSTWWNSTLSERAKRADEDSKRKAQTTAASAAQATRDQRLNTAHR